MNALLTTFAISALAVSYTTASPVIIASAINPTKNKKFTDWLVDQKIPLLYQPMFSKAKVPQEIADKAIADLITFHKKIQNLSLEVSWKASQGGGYDKTISEKFQQMAIAERAKLAATLGTVHYKAFRKVESLQCLVTQVDRLGHSHSLKTPLTSSQKETILTVLSQHLLDQDGMLIEDTQSAYPAMVKDAKAKLPKNCLDAFLLRFKDEKSWGISIHRPVTLTPGNISSRKF